MGRKSTAAVAAAAVAMLGLLALAGRADDGEDTFPGKCYDCRGMAVQLVACDKCKGTGGTGEQCPTCRGKGPGGADKSTGVITCPDCAGARWKHDIWGVRCACVRCNAAGAFKCPDCVNGSVKCTACKGTGKVSRPCPRCGGTGIAGGRRDIQDLEAKRIHLQQQIAKLNQQLAEAKKQLEDVEGQLVTARAQAQPKK
jgi:DnaJ-class molecular chaperone